MEDEAEYEDEDQEEEAEYKYYDVEQLYDSILSQHSAEEEEEEFNFEQEDTVACKARLANDTRNVVNNALQSALSDFEKRMNDVYETDDGCFVCINDAKWALNALYRIYSYGCITECQTFLRGFDIAKRCFRRLGDRELLATKKWHEKDIVRALDYADRFWTVIDKTVSMNVANRVFVKSLDSNVIDANDG